MKNLYNLFKPLLFKLPTEFAHKLALNFLKFYPYFNTLPENSIDILGLNFANRIGLAAGLDKNGDYIDALAKLGFSFIEVGTVTPLAQSGNSKPRLFRLPKAEAIINRMGFNNKGVDYLIANLTKTKFRGIIGVNIGKNATTSIDNASKDYITCIDKVYSYSDYITVNLSSPNTENLRKLQHGQLFEKLLVDIKDRQLYWHEKTNKYVPIAIKIAPDITDIQLNDICEKLLKFKMDMVIICNTTCDKNSVANFKYANEAGGLSGLPLANRSEYLLAKASSLLNDKIPIISVGGIFTMNDIKHRLQLGASLVQVYTGLVYRGLNLFGN